MMHGIAHMQGREAVRAMAEAKLTLEEIGTQRTTLQVRARRPKRC